MADYHLIMDLVPGLTMIYFKRRFPSSIKLSFAQAAILIGIGLQRKSFSEISSSLRLPISQVLALFNKTMKKFVKSIRRVFEQHIEEEMAGGKKRGNAAKFQPLKEELLSSLDKEGKKILQKKSQEQKFVKKLEQQATRSVPKSFQKFEIDLENGQSVENQGGTYLVKRKAGK